MAEVKLEGVHKIYDGKVTAVRDVSVTIRDREFVVLVGPSGCGKSTVLRMIAGLEEISTGSISIDGKVVNEVPPKDRDIAMVFQNYALYPHMTVYENLAFGLKLRKHPKDEIDRRVQNAAKILGIDAYLDRKPKALSGGQRQRVALGRAIVRQPQGLPLRRAAEQPRRQPPRPDAHGNLAAPPPPADDDDLRDARSDRGDVHGRPDRGHKDGIVQQVDTPLNIYHHPANKFVAGFIGSPTMNFLSGTVRTNGTAQFVQDGSTLSIALPASYKDRLKGSTAVVLGIRPEHIFAQQQESGEHMAAITANIEVVEPVGNEIFVYFTTGTASQYVARFAADRPPEVGRSYTLLVDTSKLHFFDRETEKSL